MAVAIARSNQRQLIHAMPIWPVVRPIHSNAVRVVIASVGTSFVMAGLTAATHPMKNALPIGQIHQANARKNHSPAPRVANVCRGPLFVTARNNVQMARMNWHAVHWNWEGKEWSSHAQNLFSLTNLLTCFSSVVQSEHSVATAANVCRNTSSATPALPARMAAMNQPIYAMPRTFRHCSSVCSPQRGLARICTAHGDAAMGDAVQRPLSVRDATDAAIIPMRIAVVCVVSTKSFAAQFLWSNKNRNYNYPCAHECPNRLSRTNAMSAPRKLFISLDTFNKWRRWLNQYNVIQRRRQIVDIEQNSMDDLLQVRKKRSHHQCW